MHKKLNIIQSKLWEQDNHTSCTLRCHTQKTSRLYILVPYRASDYEANMALASHPRERNDCNTNQQRLQSTISAVPTIANHNARNANNDANQSRMRYAHFGSQL
jgi:hypothetical protein